MKKLFLFIAALCAVNAMATEGALSGKFSVSSTKKVVFSQGNLQATTTDYGANWTWAFAANQWDYIGGTENTSSAEATTNNKIYGNGAATLNGTVDLFGWSTAATVYGIHNSTDNSTYSGDFVDWGNNMGNGWRTLTRNEWQYIFKNRPNAASLFGLGTVNGRAGVIVLPDDWVKPTDLSFTPSPSSGLELNDFKYEDTNNVNHYLDNVYTESQWSKMSAAGAVFLPAAGGRFNNNKVNYVGRNGIYWSATLNEEIAAYCFKVDTAFLSPQLSYQRQVGLSVRLVKDYVQTKQMTPVTCHLNWDESNNEWGLTVYDDPDDPTFLFTFAVTGTKDVLPTSMVLSGSTNDMYAFVDTSDPYFECIIKNANITIEYDGGLRTKDVSGSSIIYVPTKISGELTDAAGNKLIVNAPANFIDSNVSGVSISTAVDQIEDAQSSNCKFIKEDQLLIMRDGKVYSAQGQLMK